MELGWSTNQHMAPVSSPGVRLAERWQNRTLLELSLLSAPTFPDPNTDVGRSHEFTWEVLPGADMADTVKEAGVVNAPTIAHLPQVRR